MTSTDPEKLRALAKTAEEEWVPPVHWFVCTKCGNGRRAKPGERTAVCDRCPYMMIPQLDEKALLARIDVPREATAELPALLDALQEAQAERDEARANFDDLGRLYLEPCRDMRDQLRAAIEDIDAHAALIAEDEDGMVTTGYVVSVGAIHRALALARMGGPNPIPTTAAALQEAQERGDRYEAALERIKSHLEAEDRELAALIPGERDWVAREVIRPGLDIARAALQGDTNR